MRSHNQTWKSAHSLIDHNEWQVLMKYLKIYSNKAAQFDISPLLDVGGSLYCISNCFVKTRTTMHEIIIKRDWEQNNNNKSLIENISVSETIETRAGGEHG